MFQTIKMCSGYSAQTSVYIVYYHRSTLDYVLRNGSNELGCTHTKSSKFIYVTLTHPYFHNL